MSDLFVPKVSVGVPVYNGEEFLAEAIESVLNQTYKNIELIISDNASTDATQSICEYYRNLDDRVVYFRSDRNFGAAWNFNNVVNLSQAEYFKWLACDDYIDSDFIQNCVEIMERDSDIVLCYSDVYIVDEQNKTQTVHAEFLRTDSREPLTRFRDLLLEWSMCFEVFGLIRMNTLELTPMMGNYGHGDGVLLARLALLGRFYKLPGVHMFSRKHPNQSMRQFGLSEAGGNDYHKYAVWFDPKNADKLQVPNWKILAEYYRSIWDYPLSGSNRIKSHLYFLIWIRQHIRHLLNDVRYAGVFIAGRL